MFRSGQLTGISFSAHKWHWDVVCCQEFPCKLVEEVVEERRKKWWIDVNLYVWLTKPVQRVTSPVARFGRCQKSRENQNLFSTSPHFLLYCLISLWPFFNNRPDLHSCATINTHKHCSILCIQSMYLYRWVSLIYHFTETLGLTRGPPQRESQIQPNNGPLTLDDMTLHR